MNGKKLYKSADKKVCGVCGGIAEYFGMNSRLKKYAGALAIIVGVLLAWEAASEANTMFMIESICLAVIGMCYVLPVRDAIKHLISESEKVKDKQKQPETEMFLIR